MANSQILSDVLVLKIQDSGERFQRIHLLCPERGILSLMKRRAGKTPLACDLFDQGEATVDLKSDNASGFLNQFLPTQKRTAIGSSYQRLKTASWLSNFFLANPIHEENLDSNYQLALRSLDAIDAGHPCDAVLLKTLFVYSRDEGYPLHEDWAASLHPSLRQSVPQILNTPLASLQMSDHDQHAALEALIHYIRHHTHISLGDAF